MIYLYYVSLFFLNDETLAIFVNVCRDTICIQQKQNYSLDIDVLGEHNFLFFFFKQTKENK